MFTHLHKFIFYFFIGNIPLLSAYSQNESVIRVKKENQYFLFFQKGNKSDTIIRNRNDLFYLLVPDSLKESVSFSVENGQIVRTSNDSLVRVNYIQGLRYEYSFELSMESKIDFLNSNSKKAMIKRTGSYKTLINGTSTYATGKILIQVRNTLKNIILDELVLYYRPE